MLKRGIKRISIVIGIIAILYTLVIFGSIPEIQKWRDIYIETAMSTMTKQWLATAFIPKHIINEVMAQKYTISTTDKLVSQWSNIRVFKAEEVNKEIDIKYIVKKDTTQSDRESKFFEKYWEIDKNTFYEYVDSNKEILSNGYDDLYINKSGLGDSGTGIKTIFGEQVLAIDNKNNIIIVKVDGKGYKGKLAIVKEPNQIDIAIASNKNNAGDMVKNIALDNNALIAVNASGFYDPGGKGNGGTVLGAVIKDGDIINPRLNNSGNNIIGFGYDNKLYTGKTVDTDIIRCAVEFRPLMIVNGQKLVKGSAGWGLQPRTIIGQSDQGEVLILIVDGRQIGHSIGATLEQCADVMLQHKAYQAANLDGGSSSVMVYEGESITKPSNGNADGRRVPNGFIVKRASK